MENPGELSMFVKARRFLADAGYKRNVRVQDIVAVITTAMTGNINAGQALAADYNTAGAFTGGALDSSGNMPMSSMGVVIGSALCLPRRWVATEEPAIEQAWQQLTQDCSRIATVANTNIIAKHATFNGRYSSLATGIGTGPLYGVPAQTVVQQMEQEPLLVVKPGERVSQSLFVRRALALGAVSVQPELVLRTVLADDDEG